jgi:hypothetical protein
LIIEKTRLSKRKEKVDETENSSMEWWMSSKVWSFQAVTIPPEAPLEGLKIMDRSEGGRKEEARKLEMSASLDSWIQRIEGRKDSIAALKSSRF